MPFPVFERRSTVLSLWLRLLLRVFAPGPGAFTLPLLLGIRRLRLCLWLRLSLRSLRLLLSRLSRGGVPRARHETLQVAGNLESVQFRSGSLAVGGFRRAANHFLKQSL